MVDTATAGQIWVGKLRVAKKPTRMFDAGRIENHVLEAVYFDLLGDDEHLWMSDGFDFVVEEATVAHDNGTVVMTFPAKIVDYDGGEDEIEIAIDNILHFVRTRIATWYEGMKKFDVSLTTD